MGSIGPPELIAIGILALLVFGPKRLPEIGKNVGAAIREFRRASRDLMSHFEEHEPSRARAVPHYSHEADAYPAMTDHSGYGDAYATSALTSDTPEDGNPAAEPSVTAEADPRAVATSAPSADGNTYLATAATPAAATAAEAERKA